MADIDLTVEYDSPEKLFVVTGDGPDCLPASSFLCEALGALYDTDPSRLPSLYSFVDLDALDRLLDRPDASVSVRFSYEDAVITMLDSQRLHCQFVRVTNAGHTAG